MEALDGNVRNILGAAIEVAIDGVMTGALAALIVAVANPLDTGSLTAVFTFATKRGLHCILLVATTSGSSSSTTMTSGLDAPKQMHKKFHKDE